MSQLPPAPPQSAQPVAAPQPPFAVPLPASPAAPASAALDAPPPPIPGVPPAHNANLFMMPFPPPLNAKQTAKRQSKAVEDTIALRKHHWPNVSDDQLWLLSDKNKKGFAQLPRPLPILMNMIGDASKQVSPKAVPAGRSYLVLWCRVFSEALVKIDNEMAAASEAGYFGERSVSTWREHMRVLKELGFIDYKVGPSGPMHYILLLNPYKVAKELRAKNWIQEAPYSALFQRALEIGAGPELAEG